VIRALLLGLLGAASFAAVYLATAPDELREPAPVAAAGPALDEPPTLSALQFAPPIVTRLRPVRDSDAVPFELRPGGTAAIESADEPTAVRDVTPETMTAPPLITSPLTRVEPVRVLPQAAAETRMERLHNPVVTAAGVIRTGQREIRLGGIEAPAPHTSCGAGAAAWPCGRLARTALRRFVRGRAIECAVPAGADEVPDVAQCDIGGEDISAWLVAQGWAKANGEAYSRIEAEARAAGLGLWSARRPDLQTDALTATR
jgi:endonuclease YncB( thermonuclease family)